MNIIDGRNVFRPARDERVKPVVETGPSRPEIAQLWSVIWRETLGNSIEIERVTATQSLSKSIHLFDLKT